MLFTEAPLSIQVHPDDAFARRIGLPNGKTEAWYVLAARPDARIALGLRCRLNGLQLRAAIEDGSIEGLVDWRPVVPDQVMLVPAGTIHALGAGLVIAEIQQRSDATFRLFDYGRGRPLDIEMAVAVAKAEPAPARDGPVVVSEGQTILVTSPWFGMARIHLAAHSTWKCQVQSEAWLLVLSGSAMISDLAVSIGNAVFLEHDFAEIQVGASDLVCLFAYVDIEMPPLLSRNPACEVDDNPQAYSMETHP